MKYKIIEPVSKEPVTLSEAKDHLRRTSGIFADDTTEDNLISAWITAAREYCEAHTRRALAEQTAEAYLENFPEGSRINLPLPPLISVISVVYKDGSGNETTMIENTDYIVDTNSNVGGIILPFNKSWPCFTPFPLHPITITFKAGYAEGNIIPKCIKQAMLLLIGHWDNNREAAANSVSKEIEFAVKALLSIKKARWLL